MKTETRWVRGRTRTESIPLQSVDGGDVLGWSWLFSPFTWHFQTQSLEATQAIIPPFYWHFEARAMKPTESLFLYATRVRETCEQNHDLRYALLKRTVAVVIQRLQAMHARLLELIEKSPSVARKSANSKGSNR